MTKKEALAILPSEPLEARVDPQSLVIFIIAPPKWGKTKFFMANSKSLLLGFEEGHKFQRGKKITIDIWHQKKPDYPIKKDKHGVMHMSAMQALAAIKAAKGLYDFVILDTVDMAAKLCSDYHCEQGGVDHPSELGDYGRGWEKAITNPMRKYIFDILKCGCGVGLISHTKTEIAKFTDGEKAKLTSTLPKGVRQFVETQADVIMHGEFGRKRPGMRLRDRVLVCEGDMDTLAGNRSGAMLPNRYIVDPEKPWLQFARFFKDPDASIAAEREFKKLSKSNKAALK